MVTSIQPERVELFVRSLSPGTVGGPVEGQLQRLRHLATTESVELAVTVWGREVGLSTTAARTDAGEHLLDRVGRFRDWADERGVSLDPFFESREVRSEPTGERYTSLVLPVACLAEYDDGDLAHVAPHSTGEAVCSVADRVERLEAQATPEYRPDGPPRETRRPLTGQHGTGP